jgi:hypothetical protein
LLETNAKEEEELRAKIEKEEIEEAKRLEDLEKKSQNTEGRRDKKKNYRESKTPKSLRLQNS